MEVEFSPLEGKSPQFRAFLLVLLVVAGAGLFATYLFYARGLHLTGLSNRVPWGISIVMAIFYIGLSAGALVLSALSVLSRKKEFQPFARTAVLLAMFLLIGGLLSIILDWGRPDRLFIPMIYSNPLSMFSINGILYPAFIGVCFIFLLALFSGNQKWISAIAVLAVICAIVVRTGTGVIFGFMPRELFHSSLLPPSFIATALSSGIALIIILLQLLFRYTRRPFDERYVKKLSKILSLFIIVVFYFLFLENAFRAYVPASREAEWYFLFSGPHNILFWWGLIGAGILIPAAILFNPGTKNSIKMINVAAALHIIGVLCEKYLAVVPAQTHAADILPNMHVESVALDGANVGYSISLLEAVQVLGIAALIAIAFILGLRYFAMLPTKALIEEDGS
jgi:molybdopterin-containing oxidoreductase family membrane subunit